VASTGGDAHPAREDPSAPRDEARASGKAPQAGPGGWLPWAGPLALLAGLALALAGALLIDIPAAVLGTKISESRLPPGLVIADTYVQDLAFVLAAVFFAQLGGRAVAAWQFGLRPTRAMRALAAATLAAVAFFLFLVLWSSTVHTTKEKLLETLGTRQSTALLVSSAVLTCVIAPICEELLFRGFMFRALRNWRGVWPAAAITGLLFGAVHALGGAPASDLVPLAVLGFLLCLLYDFTGSLYPCIALHALNNSIAFAGLEEWTAAQGFALVLGALSLIALLVLVLTRAGVIGPAPAAEGGAQGGSVFAGG
jgi:membrane protease YdiL (CAAX protease family)